MRDIEDFLTLVMKMAPAAPEPLVIDAIRETAITFCERTRLWRCHDTIITDGADPEPVAVPADSVMYEVTACSIDGRSLDPISLDKLADERPDWRTEDIGSGGAQYFLSPKMGTVMAVPRTAGTLTVEFVAKPAGDAQTLPGFLLDHYSQAIADGAAGAVLITPNEAFGNGGLGAGLIARFEAKLNSLFNAGRRGQQRAPSRARARFM